MVTIVIEGGGTGPALKADMAQGFRGLFDKITPPIDKPRLIRGGGRSQALDKFEIAWKECKAGDIVMLLIDSDEPLEFGASKLAHLKKRHSWTSCPPNASEDDVFLMVCVMETWICADRRALRQFFDGGFDESKLPAPNAALEKVERGRLYDCLERATASCKRREPYQKGGPSFELIGMIDPVAVEVLPHARQFFEAMRSRLGRSAPRIRR